MGAVELEIWGYGNSWYVPSLSKLWDLQAGYRYKLKQTNAIMNGQTIGLVLAYEGGDPYIFDTDTGIILDDAHGQGIWDPKPLFEDLGYFKMSAK